jgi:hypothetical protein
MPTLAAIGRLRVDRRKVGLPFRCSNPARSSNFGEFGLWFEYSNFALADPAHELERSIQLARLREAVVIVITTTFDCTLVTANDEGKRSSLQLGHRNASLSRDEAVGRSCATSALDRCAPARPDRRALRIRSLEGGSR